VRIVSLLPSATEILFGIGAGSDVVGVTHECDFPDAVRALPKLTSSALESDGSSADIDRHVRRNLHAGSSLYHLDSASLERLAPDLIVTQELCDVCAVSYATVDRAAKRLRGDPRLVSLEPSSLDDVFATIRFLGELTGRDSGARILIDGLQKRVDRLRRRSDRFDARPRTLILEWTDPPMGAGHWSPGLVELAGGVPVLARPGADSQPLAWNAIAAADPDVVIVGPCGFDLARTRHAIAELDSIAEWTALRAYRSKQIFAIDGNAYLNRPGPRLVDTAEILARMIDGTAAVIASA
jgi:iron complex transport system substrate-binding protein